MYKRQLTRDTLLKSGFKNLREIVREKFGYPEPEEPEGGEPDGTDIEINEKVGTNNSPVLPKPMENKKPDAIKTTDPNVQDKKKPDDPKIKPVEKPKKGNGK